MIITYATAHKWMKPITAAPTEYFGKNMKARIRSTLKRIEKYDIETEIRELDDDFLEWFLQMYEKRIQQKDHPVVFDIRGKTIGKPNIKKTYYSLTLYENKTPIGGTIFSRPKNRLSVAYRTYKNAWVSAQLSANPSLYTEYVICKYAYDTGQEVLIHGKDRNPYGINSSIGLAAFKLAVGCQPVKSVKYEVEKIDTNGVHCNALILEYPGAEEKEITNAHLVTMRDDEYKYVQVTKYPERLRVHVHYRD